MEDYKMSKEEYKEEIKKMLDKIDNIEWLRFVHRIIKNLIG